MIYTGIGSRAETLPDDIKQEFIFIGRRFAERGWTLRSGGADGADSAFEWGCGLSATPASKEIFLPWKGFNNNPSPFYITDENKDDLFEIASKIYPSWNYVKEPIKLLHARNVQQVLGEKPRESLITDFIVCWTNRPDGEARGTGFAMVMAKLRNIPVYNFYKPEERQRFYKEVFKNGQPKV